MKEMIRTEMDDGTVREVHTENGLLNRNDGPAITLRRPDGFYREEYWLSGIPHREDGPALTQRDADGLTHEEYYHQGKLHREAPAAIERLADGTVIYEAYWRHGERHRDNGPALVKHTLDGSSLQREEYWLNGQQVDSLQEDTAFRRLVSQYNNDNRERER